MRRFSPFVCALFGPALLALADPAPEDFAGIKWGMGVTDAQSTLARRDGLTIDSHHSSSTKLRFTGGMFAGFPAEAWELSFGPEGLFFASVWLRDEGKESGFAKIKQALSEKYGGGRTAAVGTPTRYYDWILGRWENGKVIHPRPDTSWHLQSSFSGQWVEIRCSPEKGNRVHLTYVNETLARAMEKTPAKASKKDL